MIYLPDVKEYNGLEEPGLPIGPYLKLSWEVVYHNITRGNTGSSIVKLNMYPMDHGVSVGSEKIASDFGLVSDQSCKY